MSALPPKADIAEHRCDVRYVPETEVATFIRRPPEPSSSEALGA